MSLTALAAFMERHTLQSVLVAGPAMGDPIIYTVPSNQVIQVVGLRFELTTGVVAADRRVAVFAYQDVATGLVQGSVASIIQTASLTWTYYFSCGIAPVDATHEAYTVFAPLACGIQLQAGEQLQIIPYNMDAGDQFSAMVIRLYGWKED